MSRLIDADKLIKTIRENDYLVVDYFNNRDRGMFTSGILQAIDEQLSAQPEQRCIPCSERLPEFSVHKKDPYLGEWDNSEPVLVYCKNSEGIFESQYLIAEYTNGFWEEEQGDRNGWCEIELADEIVDVIAWMPLPEPYDPLTGHMNPPEE